MPDEATPAPENVQDTPTPEAPADPGGQGEPTPADAEQGYLRQADYTRKTQELADQRKAWEAEKESFLPREIVEAAVLQQDPQAAQELLEQLGYDFDEDEQGGGDDAFALQQQRQIDELTEWRQQQEQDAAMRENASHVSREFARLAGEPWNPDNPSHDAILALAFAHDQGDGPTNIEAGYKAYEALRDSIIDEFKQGKFNAPSAQETGSPAATATNEDMSLADKIRLGLERNSSPVT